MPVASIHQASRRSISPAQAGAPYATLPLAPDWLDALARLGHDAMTPLQASMLPAALSGRDVIVQVRRDRQTNDSDADSELALALAVLHRLDARRFDVQALWLCPTPDAADRVARCMRGLAQSVGHIKVAMLCHGAPMRMQIDSLIHGAHIVVGTPGRLLDHVDAATLDLRAINTVVFDQADTLLELGYVDDIAFVASRCPRLRQTLLMHGSADADLPPDLARLGRLWMRRPHLISQPV
ncbi:DEAD/DEAH box helicase [Cupriavidus sp. SW-Y-13]|uniref:DEAD/DEAH box helicase n=1 Tax=Cupriavidus sp. SW-Y-13 TaxID=2653854 RepID=UPI0013667A91|nr:DEAD/DEAH box helicase [Cupriavidus sp. SW-Y-13]MWL85845.1 DEAD/DEAH box helicase [Cupriavidus sp. SW-Y-13]